MKKGSHSTSSSRRKKRNQRKEEKKQCKQPDVKKPSDLSNVMHIDSVSKLASSSSVQILSPHSSTNQRNFTSPLKDQEFPELGASTKKILLPEDKTKVTETAAQQENSTSKYVQLQHKCEEDVWHTVGRKGKAQHVEIERETETPNLDVIENPKCISNYAKESTHKSWSTLAGQKCLKQGHDAFSTNAVDSFEKPKTQSARNTQLAFPSSNSKSAHIEKGACSWRNEGISLNTELNRGKEVIIGKESSQKTSGRETVRAKPETFITRRTDSYERVSDKPKIELDRNSQSIFPTSNSKFVNFEKSTNSWRNEGMGLNTGLNPGKKVNDKEISQKASGQETIKGKHEVFSMNRICSKEHDSEMANTRFGGYPQLNPSNGFSKAAYIERNANTWQNKGSISEMKPKEEKKIIIDKKLSETNQKLKNLQRNVLTNKVNETQIAEKKVLMSKQDIDFTDVDQGFSRTSIKANQEDQEKTLLQSNGITAKILKNHQSVNTCKKQGGEKSFDTVTKNKGSIPNSQDKINVNEKQPKKLEQSGGTEKDNNKISVKQDEQKNSNLNKKSKKEKNEMKTTQNKNVVDSNKKKRPKTKDLMEIDLRSIVQANKPTKQNVKNKTDKKIIKSDDKPVSRGNVLDSSNPVRHQGKVRLHKPKRPSKLRQVILKERYMRHINLVKAVVQSFIEEKEAQIRSDGTCSNIELEKIVSLKNADSKVIENILSKNLLSVTSNSVKYRAKTGQESSVCDFDNSVVNNVNCFHNCHNTKRCLLNNPLNEETCATPEKLSPSYDDDKHFLLQEVPDPITDLVKSLEKFDCKENVDTSKSSKIDMTEEDVAANKSSSSANENRAGKEEHKSVDEKLQTTSVIYETSVVNQYSPPKPPGIHTRKFRDYCDHWINSDINGTVENLLTKLVRLQTRAYERNPVTALARRRYVLGLREVKKHLIDLKKVKLLIIAPDLDKIESEGGIYYYIDSFKTAAHALNVPYVFALNRSKLAYYTLKTHVVSCVGILNYDSCQELVSKLLNAVAVAREKYFSLLKDHGYPIEQDSKVCSEDVENLKSNENEKSKSENVTTEIIQSFLSKLRDDKTEEKSNVSSQSRLLGAIENCCKHTDDDDDDDDENDNYF